MKKYDYVSGIWRADADSKKANVPAIKRVLRKLVREAVLLTGSDPDDDYDEWSPTNQERKEARWKDLQLEANRISKELIP